MLIATLNHNLPDLTDNLVKQLEKDESFGYYELMVVDNGSTEPLAKSTTHQLEENIFFGGGFNVVLDYFLNTDHDYLYFLNNDLIFHGPSFLTTSLNEAKQSDAAVYSPTIINASTEQCHWKQMWNWGKNTQWAGRQLTVGLTVPLIAFGAQAAKAFREADQELVRLTKVYGDTAGTSAAELGRVRKEVSATAKEISSAMGVSFKETIGLAADIAATGKTGDELLGSFIIEIISSAEGSLP